MSRFVRGALLVVAVVWWAPTLLLGLALVGVFHLNTWRIVRRARRLRLAGRHAEALVVLEQARREVTGDRGPTDDP